MLCEVAIMFVPELLTHTYFCGPPTIYHLPTPCIMYIILYNYVFEVWLQWETNTYSNLPVS